MRVDGAAGPLALGAKGSACDRLRLTGGLRALALGSYIVSLRWRGTAPSAPFFIPPLAAKTIQPPCGRRKCIPPLVAGATTLPGGKHVTGFSVAYGSLRIQFLCHPRSSVGRQKESALMGRLGALLRPTWRSYAGPPQWHYKAPLCCELLMKGLLFRALFCPPDGGKSGAAG